MLLAKDRPIRERSQLMLKCNLSLYKIRSELESAKVLGSAACQHGTSDTRRSSFDVRPPTDCDRGGGCRLPSRSGAGLIMAAALENTG